jgi:hypothetical protein
MSEFSADVLAGLMSELEAYGDAFERLARTREQKQLASQFQQLVSELPKLLIAAMPTHLTNATQVKLFGLGDDAVHQQRSITF